MHGPQGSRPAPHRRHRPAGACAQPMTPMTPHKIPAPRISQPGGFGLIFPVPAPPRYA